VAEVRRLELLTHYMLSDSGPKTDGVKRAT
jgi:hypothetical protein